jgi:RNA polymerase sigma-70 factor (ECF subfamily)
VFETDAGTTGLKRSRANRLAGRQVRSNQTTASTSHRPAFDRWYQTAWPKLVGSLVVITRDRDVAEDVASEAMLRMYERWDTVEVERPDAWVHTVAVNLARRRAVRLALELRHASSTAKVLDAAPSLEPVLWHAVAGLPRQQRIAVALRYVGDLTEAEVAAAMDRSPGTIAATLSTARARLRQTLGPTFLEDER